MVWILGKEPWYPLDRRFENPIDGLDDVKKKKYLATVRNQIQNIQLVAYHYTELSHLPYINHMFFQKKNTK
jgi:hypothetical protein